jgi:hypothetical protein
LVALKFLTGWSSQKRLGLAEMGHQELVSQHNITHWSHMEGMEWSSSNRWGVVAANRMSFGSDLVLDDCSSYIVLQSFVNK